MANLFEHITTNQELSQADSNTNQQQGTSVSRRGFLIGSGGAGLTLAFGLTGFSYESASQQINEGAFSPTVWYEIDKDGKITVNIAKAEMGQHVGTALARVVAEELEANWEDVNIVYVDSDPKWGYMVTGGSWSVHNTFFQLSRAGAAGRIELIKAGASLLDADASKCIARNSKVMLSDDESKSVSYAQIISDASIDKQYSDEELAAIELKPVNERRLLNEPIKALDIPAKVNGSAKYGIDSKVDGMVYAHPVLPPSRFGCRVKSFDDSQAKNIPGYIETVEIVDPSNVCQGWLAVIAEHTFAAMSAANMVKVDWQLGETSNINEEDLITEAKNLVEDEQSGALWVDIDDAAQKISDATDSSKIIRSEFTTHTVLHFHLEPVNALAYEKDGHWHIHTGNQWQSLILPVLATALDVEASNITLHQYYLGGGFGRRLYGDYAVPAALLAKKLGKPVKLMFSREADSWLDSARSPSFQRIKTLIDDNGKPLVYDYAGAAGWPTAAMIPGFLTEGAENGKGKADPFSVNGADHWYDVPSQRIRTIEVPLVKETFVPGWLRSVGVGWITWATEQHYDEVALASTDDPLAYRLSILTGQGRNEGQAPHSVNGAKRLANALQRVKETSSWDDRASLGEGRALGVATGYGQERSMPTWTACVVDASVDKSTGVVSINKVNMVIDAGTVVDPDGARAQIEGSILWGISMALYESTEIQNAVVKDTNLSTYKPLRINQVPEIDIEFIQSTEMPVGLGEPGVVVVAPAIANAIAAATGFRPRELPIKAEAIKSALV